MYWYRKSRHMKLKQIRHNLEGKGYVKTEEQVLIELMEQVVKEKAEHDAKTRLQVEQKRPTVQG